MMAMMPAMEAKGAYDSRWERKFEGEEAGVTRRLDTKKTPKAVLGESVKLNKRGSRGRPDHARMWKGKNARD
jgi:hypothetical protein